MSFSPMDLFPIVPKLGELFKAAVDHYAMLKASGMPVDADILAAFLELKAADWNPEIKGRRPLADPKTKTAGCRFLAGVAFSLAKG